jgi:hypothetical protein
LVFSLYLPLNASQTHTVGTSKLQASTNVRR